MAHGLISKINLGYTADVNEINTVAGIINAGASGGGGTGVVSPELFYDKQLLDTIKIPPEEFVYYKLATESPIGDKADKLVLRRLTPLEPHTVPLQEGIPPKSDKYGYERYELEANQYGRYMEFSDKVSWKSIDPIISHYTREYSYVAVGTLDALARETLFSVAQKFYAGISANFEDLKADGSCVGTMQDLRLIVLQLQRALVQPINGAYTVIGAPEFYFDMLQDPLVQQYMEFNNSTKPMTNEAVTPLPDMFTLRFQQTLVAPCSSDFVTGGEAAKLLYRPKADGTLEYATWKESSVAGAVTVTDGYVIDARTGAQTSFIPQRKIWDIDAYNAAEQGSGQPWEEMKAAHVLVVGKDALSRTGLSGEGQAKMYTKPLGSTGVLDPIDQRQSIGFKINSVGFGSTRPESVVDYVCVPTELNPY